MTWFTRWWRKESNDDQPAGILHRLEALEKRISYEFTDKSLLVLALKHRSYVHCNADPDDLSEDRQANERLEFLGDAVLGLATTAFLYRRYPGTPEGDLTKRKSVLVSKSALARCAVQVGLDRHLLMSEVEENAGGRKRRSILGDGFEALLGAMYLDGGLEPVEAFLEGELFRQTDELSREATFINYKSLLLEHVQAEGGVPPEYSLCSQTGPDHRKTFTVEVRVGEALLGRGLGRSKKDAQQVAAKMAYEHLIGESECNDEDTPPHRCEEEARSSVPPPRESPDE